MCQRPDYLISKQSINGGRTPVEWHVEEIGASQVLEVFNAEVTKRSGAARREGKFTWLLLGYGNQFLDI
jgi:hypothetical protein